MPLYNKSNQDLEDFINTALVISDSKSPKNYKKIGHFYYFQEYKVHKIQPISPTSFPDTDENIDSDCLIFPRVPRAFSGPNEFREILIVASIATLSDARRCPLLSHPYRFVGAIYIFFFLPALHFFLSHSVSSDTCRCRESHALCHLERHPLVPFAAIISFSARKHHTHERKEPKGERRWRRREKEEKNARVKTATVLFFRVYERSSFLGIRSVLSSFCIYMWIDCNV